MIERIICALLGHKYIVERICSLSTRKVGCTRCSKKWGMNDPTKTFIPWCDAQEELCEILIKTEKGA